MNYIKKYSPDILIMGGILIISYNFLRPQVDILGNVKSIIDTHVGWKIFGIFLLSVGVDIIVRRYVNKEK